MKTREEWRKSGLCLNEFLQVGDLVDDDMADYFLCVLPPATHSTFMLQVGEPYSHVNGRPTFPTIKKTADGWQWRGNCHIRETTEPMKTYIVTVHYALRIEAQDMNEAQQIAEEMTQLATGRAYVANSWEVPDIHESEK